MSAKLLAGKKPTLTRLFSFVFRQMLDDLMLVVASVAPSAL
jgi:hypothetical protein